MAPDRVVMDSLTTLRAKEVVTIAAERVGAIVFAQFAVPLIDQGHCSREKFQKPSKSTLVQHNSLSLVRRPNCHVQDLEGRNALQCGSNRCSTRRPGDRSTLRVKCLL